MPADTTRRDCVCPRARHQHGSLSAYTLDRCRCLKCRLAKHWAMAAYRSGETWRECDDRTVPKGPTVLRLRALMAIGYTSTDLAGHTGLTYRHIQQLRNGTNAAVGVDIADAVSRAYDALWDKPSTGPRSSRQRTVARRRGYLLPLALDDDLLCAPTLADFVHIENGPNLHNDGPLIVDDVAVERAMHGDTGCATKAEVSQAVATLTGMGYSAAQIADRLGVSQRTIVRKRAAA